MEGGSAALVAPHGGGGLKPLALTGEALAAERTRAQSLRAVRLSSREKGDLVMLGIGGFTPLEGFMTHADWESVCKSCRTAAGLFWPIPITLSTDDDSIRAGDEIALADPETGAPLAPGDWVDGYLSAIEWRGVSGAFGERGPATVWARMRCPLVAGEEPSPLERVLAVADSGNGVSGELDLGRWLFINPELTVHLFREAAGEWICLDAQSNIAAGGAGLATSVLSDTDGPVGVGAQSLLIAPRERRPG